MRTKTAFIIFLLLSIIVFPYYLFIVAINFDFFYSIIPGWNTTIIPAQIISNLIKFTILSVVIFYYWKLLKVTKEISYNKFLVHFFLTVPGVLFGKINLYDLLIFYNPEHIIHQIQIVVCIHIFINILFFLGQIVFWVLYVRFRKNSTLSNY